MCDEDDFNKIDLFMDSSFMNEMITSHDNYYLAYPQKEYFDKVVVKGVTYTDYDKGYWAILKAIGAIKYAK